MAAGGADPVAQSVIEVCAGLAASAGDALTAARLFGFAEAHNERTGLQRDAADARFLLPLVERARAAAPVFDEQARLGGELSLEGALSEARAWLQRPA